MSAAATSAVQDVILAVHGGAGGARRGEDGELAMRQALAACLQEGRGLLAGGASALDVVEHVVRRLESHPLFNAGRGSVLDSEGRVEMDAAVMDGRTRAAGAVACVRRLAHPVSAARLVMQGSPHVLLVGAGAEQFALSHGAEEVDPDALVTEQRRRQLDEARARGRMRLDHDAPEGGGTVGAVARDASGSLAAATSTGGLTGKLPGRVSDSALVGAGTWADDATCAVSATGHGEAFIRAALAHEVDAQVRLANASLPQACERALERSRCQGYRGGGLIALDRTGGCAMPFDTAAMFRGWIGADGGPVVRVFADE